MTIAPGTKLGAYEILSPLGAGGMGEVYRARDTRLGRDVALKVLPQEFFEDEDRVARFEREAKLLAALNHPNIAGIFAFEETSGRHLLAMELVEGESLDVRIARGAIPLEESLSLTRQIAEARSTSAPAAAANAAAASGLRPREEYDVFPDGQRLLVNTVVTEKASTPLTLVENWTALAKGK